MSDRSTTIVPMIDSSVGTVISFNEVDFQQSMFHSQVCQRLIEWLELQQQQQTLRIGFGGEEKHHEYIEFDQIMEEDLENQLKELEQKEEEQCQRIEQFLEVQLQKQTNDDKIDQLEQYCMKVLEEYDEKQQQAYQVSIRFKY